MTDKNKLTMKNDVIFKSFFSKIRMLGEMEEQASLSAAKDEGKKQNKISTAKKLLKLKMPIEQIVEVTELTKEEIIKLEKES